MLFGFGLATALAAVQMVRRRRTVSHAEPEARDLDPIQIESDDSFPASDPPSHTPTTGATVRPPGIH